LVETAASGDLDPLLHAFADRESARCVAEVLAEPGRDRLAPVLSSLRRAHAADRDRAADALSLALREGVPTGHYLSHLKAVDSDVRLMAIEIVSRLATPDAIQALVGVLERDPVSEVRSRAASALAETPDEAVTAALQRAHGRDPDRVVRRSAGRALDMTRGTSEGPTILSAPAGSAADLDSAQASS
jgi:HEAT repeat protein